MYLFKILFLATTLISFSFVIGGTAFSSNSYSGAAAGAELGALIAGFLTFFIGIIVLNIILLVWVVKDAKRRGMDNPVLWMLVVLIAGIIGLIIYLLVRPKGRIVRCEHYKNQKLEYLKTCPYCGK